MKILITTDWYKPVVNGVVTSVLNLKHELEKQGHEVRVLTLSPDGKPTYKDDTYYLKSFNVKIYPDAKGTYSFYNKYIPKILDWKPDIIHSQCEFVSFVFARHIAKALNIPIVHTYHTIYEDYTHYLPDAIPGSKLFGKKIVLSGTNRIVGSTDYVITPTNKAKDLLVSYGLNNPIITVPTGISLEKYKVRVSQERKKELLGSYGIDSDKKVLLSLGRLAQEKNIDELINNMKLLVESRQDVVLLIVGGGPYEDELRNKVKALGLEDYVKFTGMVSPEQVPEYFKLGKIFVCGSQSEAQGLTYIEALASGLPLLCKYDTCLDGVLLEGNNGYFFDSFHDFNSHVEEILSNDNLYKSLHLNALITSERFSTEVFGKTIAKVYEDALETFAGHEHLLPIGILPQRFTPTRFIPRLRTRRRHLVRRYLKR